MIDYKFSRLALLALLGLVLAASTAGCGGASQVIETEPSRPEPPAWISRLPSQPDYFYYLGVADRAESLEYGKQRALAQAMSQAASFIGVNLESELNVLDSTNRPNPEVRENLRVTSSGTIAGLEVVDEYHVKTSRRGGSLYETFYDVYILTRIGKDDAEAEKRRQSGKARDRMALAERLYGGARRDLAGGRSGEAARALEQARALVVAAEGFTAGDSELKLKIDRLLDQTRTMERAIALNLAGGMTGADRNVLFNALQGVLSSNGWSMAVDRSQARYHLRIGAAWESGQPAWGENGVDRLVPFCPGRCLAGS